MKQRFYLNPHFHQIFNCVSDGIFITDNNGICLWVNDASCQQLNCSRSELIGKSVYDLEKRNIFNPSVTKLAMAKRKTVSTVQQANNRQFLATGYPILIDEDQTEYFLGHVRDITETVRASLKLEKAEEIIKKYHQEIQRIKIFQSTSKYPEPLFIGKSKFYHKLTDLIERAASVDATVLLEGETGVGKNVVAEKIHLQSNRSDKPFIHVNCGTIPESLVESELFGYKKGAFTGANNKGKIGLVEKATGGTFFLDEIGELPLSLQPKLLQLLQSKSFIPVGDTVSRQVDIRIITATNKDLLQMVKEKNFREDLYYRLNILPIKISPLRERVEDIPSLLYHYVNQFNEKYERTYSLTNEIVDALQKYEWPGNIRELENMVERLFITAKSDKITKDDLPEDLLEKVDKKENKFSLGKQTLPSYIEKIEKKAVQEALETYKTTRKASKMLGISQSSLMRRIQKYNIKQPFI